MLRLRKQSVVLAAILMACEGPISPDAVQLQPSPAANKQGTTSSQILFSLPGPDGGLFRMNDDGTNIVPLGQPGAEHAAWAPDGKHILFRKSAGDGTLSIYMMNDDGGDVTRLTYPEPGNEDSYPAALGKGILFSRLDLIGTGGVNIFSMNADGTGLTQLVTGSLNEFRAAPSPKGTAVVFERDGDLYLLDLVTGGVMNLTNSVLIEFDAAFSPSGKEIAFSTENGRVSVMNADGTHVTTLFPPGSVYSGRNPKWSPDGKQIAFTDIGQDSEIYVMNADGTGVTNLTRTPTLHEQVTAWAKY